MLDITGAAAVRNQGADNQKGRLTRLHCSSDLTGGGGLRGGLTGSVTQPPSGPVHLQFATLETRRQHYLLRDLACLSRSH